MTDIEISFIGMNISVFSVNFCVTIQRYDIWEGPGDPESPRFS